MPCAPCKTTLSCVVSVSGFRSLVGSTMTPNVAMALAAAYAKLSPKAVRLLWARSCPTGHLYTHAIKAGLQGVGVSSILALSPPPPSFMLKELNAQVAYKFLPVTTPLSGMRSSVLPLLAATLIAKTSPSCSNSMNQATPTGHLGPSWRRNR